MYRDQDLLDPLSTAIDGQLRYDIDSQGGQSGSAVFTSLDNSWVILGVHWGHTPSDPNYNRAARFRDQMWNDVCEWVESFPTNKVFYNCG